MVLLFVLMVQVARLPSVEILGFRPETRVLSAGDTAVSGIDVRNPGNERLGVWIGYSVMAPDGHWFDVPSHRIEIGPGETAVARKSWLIPRDSVERGHFRVVIAVWSNRPESTGAIRLASAERRDAFRVRGDPALLVERPDSLWRAASHALGRGRMRADQILVAGEGFRLRVPAGSCDGAELRTAVPFSFGEYSVRMRTPFAPGSLSAFFLYGSGTGDRNDEIDIEIFNDGSRRALLTAWTGGTKSRESSVTLPFDPAGDAHDYTIRWTARSLEFLADGRRLARWTANYPHTPMRIMASVWWPRWLSCRPASDDRLLLIDRIGLRPEHPLRVGTGAGGRRIRLAPSSSTR